MICSLFLLVLPVLALDADKDEADFKAGADPASLELFQTGANFARHSPNLFGDSSASQLDRLISWWRKNYKLSEMAGGLTISDLSALLAVDRTGSLIVAVLPLLNHAPVELAESLPIPTLIRIATMPEFDKKLLSRLSTTKQEGLLNNGLDARSIGSLRDTVIKSVIVSKNCHRLDKHFFKQLPFELAPYITGTCLNNTKAVGLSFPANTISRMPTDVFEDVDPTILNPTVYKSMTSKQLESHLRNMTPSATQLQVVPTQTILAALKALIIDPSSDITESRVELVERCPPNAMGAFTKSFWENASERANWKLNSAQLISLPPDAFSLANPEVLFKLSIKPTSPLHAEHSRLEELVSNLGRGARQDGHHPCAKPAGLLRFMKPRIYSKLSAECITIMEPVLMREFQDSTKLNALSLRAVGTLTSTHIAVIPAAAINDNTKPFLLKLFEAAATQYNVDDPTGLACSGLTADQLKGIRAQSIWSAMSYECLSVMENTTLQSISDESFTFIKPNVIGRMNIPVDDGVSGLETMTELIKKMSPAQIQALGSRETGDESIHPCNAVKTQWTAIGAAKNLEATNKVPPKCFALFDPSTYTAMPEKALSRMSEDILSHIDSSDRMSKIPARAFVEIRKDQVSKLDVGAVAGLAGDHMLAIGATGATQHLSAKAVARLSGEAFMTCIRENLKLSKEALSLVTVQHVGNGEIIKGFGRNVGPLQWSNLSIDLPVSQSHLHPCSAFTFENLQLSENTVTFWEGVNARCFAALTFLDKLTEEELKHVPDAAFASLDSSQRALIAGRLGAENAWKLQISGDCSKYTPETFAKLSLVHRELLSDECLSKIPPKVIERLKGSQDGHVPMRALQIWNAEQIMALPKIEGDVHTLSHYTHGASCEAITPQHLQNGLRLGDLSIDCVLRISPSFFSKISTEQLDELEVKHWKSALTKLHVEAIPPAILAKAKKLLYLGRNFEKNPSLHPCYGLTRAVFKSWDAAQLMGIQKACQRLLDQYPPLSHTASYFIFIYLFLGSCVLAGLGSAAYFIIYKRHQ